MSFGYIDLKEIKNEFNQKEFQIEIAKIKYKANLQTIPLHDPNNILIKS